MNTHHPLFVDDETDLDGQFGGLNKKNCVIIKHESLTDESLLPAPKLKNKIEGSKPMVFAMG